MNKHHLPHVSLLVGFLMMMASGAAGQVNTVKPSEPVERQLSADQKFREWAHQSDVADAINSDIKRIKVCRVEELCKM
jgi:hypothetical protein